MIRWLIMEFSEWVDKKNVCIIMRGLPGSGKSYKVRELLVKFGGDHDHVFSADKYFDHLATEAFIQKHGRKPDPSKTRDVEELADGYRRAWHPSRLGQAHKFCYEQFCAAVDLGITPVILDNTNTMKSQFGKYFQYAEKEGYKVRIEEPESQWWKAARDDLGNTKIKYSDKLKRLKEELLAHGQHGVPSETITKLIDETWQNIPGGVGQYVTYDQVFNPGKRKH